MNENLLATIQSYLDDSFNDGVDRGRDAYKADAMLSLGNMAYDLLHEGKANQAEAIHEAIKRMEQLN